MKNLKQYLMIKIGIRIGRHVYIKKGNIMEVIENKMNKRHRRWGNYR